MIDNINHPAHYESGNYECIDVMAETQGIDAVKNSVFVTRSNTSIVISARTVTRI